MTEQIPLNTDHRPVRLKVEDYLLLDRSGAFDAYAKTELLDGEIFYPSAQHRPHARTKMALYETIRAALSEIGSTLGVLVEVSVGMPDHSVPEPDLVLTDEPDGEGLVPLRSVALIIEVSDTTQRTDLGRKVSLCARGGVPEYWVVDIERRVLEQFWMPSGERYGNRRAHRFGAPVTATTIAGLTIETGSL